MLQVDEALRALADQDRALPGDELIRRIESRLLAESAPIPRVAGPPASPPARDWRRRPVIAVAGAVLATLVLVGGVALLAFRDASEVVDDPPVPPTIPSTIAPSTTVPTTSVPPTSLTPVTTVPAPTEPTPNLPFVAAGNDCAYVAELGYDYGAALAYWVREDRPARMDGDGNGIPCEEAYTAAQIGAVLEFDAAQPTEDPDVGSGDGGPLGSGLLCADLADLGYGFAPVLAYWVREGAPARMDADGNGLPCETVYARGEIETVIGFDGTAFRSPPAATTGWSPTTLAGSVTPACCGTNATGPVSPPLPPATGGFPDDGEYNTEIQRAGASVTVRLRRWVPCSEAPDQCLEPQEGDITGDRSRDLTMVLPLDSELTVVLHPIDMPDSTAVAGDGAAFAKLLATLDAAYDLWFSPDLEASCFEPERLPSDATGCPFVSLWDPFNGPRAYRGPRGSYLVMPPKPPDGPTPEASAWGPDELYGWDVALVVSDGKPILHVGAGRIAG